VTIKPTVEFSMLVPDAYTAEGAIRMTQEILDRFPAMTNCEVQVDQGWGGWHAQVRIWWPDVSVPEEALIPLAFLPEFSDEEKAAGRKWLRDHPDPHEPPDEPGYDDTWLT
jgi:hypothetical protein